MADKSFSRMESTCLEDEIDFLSAVFFEELQISDENTRRNEKVLFLNLEPSTADDKTKQFVFVKLKVVIPNDYPTVSPIWSTVNSRGLSDELLDSLLSEARQISENKIGHPMLYEVIEHLKVYLTEQNKPSEACCVCMCEFDTDGEYTKTNCFHFFHLACFASYVDITLEKIQEGETEIQVAGAERDKVQLECPVCREVLPADSQCMEDIRGVNPGSFFTSPSPVFKLSLEMREQQAKRAELFERQRAKGGVIDLEEEAAKFDMDSTWRPPTPEEVATPEIAPTDQVEAKIVEEEPLVFSKTGTEDFGTKIDCQPIVEHSKQTTNTTTTRQTSPRKTYSRDKQRYSGDRRNYSDNRDRPRQPYRGDRDRGYRRDARPPYQQERDKECYYNDYKPRYKEYRGKNGYYDEYR